MPDHALRFEDLKRYVRFDDDDARLLAALAPHVEPHLDDIVGEFYARAREHEGAHAVFSGEEQIARLHRSLKAWLRRTLQGPYDAAYSEASRHIGQVHVRVGLPQRYVFAAMSVFRLRLQEIVEDTMGDRARATARALSRILDIELAMMSDAFHEASVELVAKVERERRRYVLAALDGAARRHVLALEVAGVMIVGLDHTGCIQLFNPCAERLSGYLAAEVRGQPFGEALRLGGGDLIEGWETLVDSTEAREIDASFTLTDRHGRTHDIVGRLSCAASQQAHERLVVFAGRDVTGERALAERAHRAERLAAVGTLAAGLAHEIRNPLNGALLHLTFLDRALRRQAMVGELVDAVGVVRTEITRLSALVTEFLEFARPSVLHLVPTALDDVCRRALLVAQDQSGTVRMRSELAAGLVAQVDADKVEQVLLNLLQNAVEAASAGDGGQVSLRAYREPRYAVLEVVDDGPGVPAAAPIFDAFYSTKPQGTGLGLSITNRIVEDHGGRLELDRRPGETVFRVRLPIEQPPLVTTLAPAGREKP